MMRAFEHMSRALLIALGSGCIGVAGGADAREPGRADSLWSAQHTVALAVPALAILPDAAFRRVADQTSGAPPMPKVTREQAVAIALRVVSGEVTSVEIEPKRGKLVYAVEILTSDGEETDVLVDTETGEVLGTE